LLHRLADDAAFAAATTAAADLFVQHLAAEEERAVADRVAQQHPADRLLGLQVFLLAVFHLERVLPFDVGVEMAVVEVDLQLQRADLDHAFERVQLRADEKHLHRVAVGAQLAGELGILEAGLVAQAQEKPLGAFDAEHFDQLAAHTGHHRRLHQQHALFVEPDLAFGAEETHPFGEVLQRRRRFRRPVLGNHSRAPLACSCMGNRRVPLRHRRVVGRAGTTSAAQARLGSSLLSKPPETCAKVNRRTRWSFARSAVARLSK
jgi:hypothetical protein